jgi:hypothetical protein
VESEPWDRVAAVGVHLAVVRVVADGDVAPADVGVEDRLAFRHHRFLDLVELPVEAVGVGPRGLLHQDRAELDDRVGIQLVPGLCKGPELADLAAQLTAGGHVARAPQQPQVVRRVGPADLQLDRVVDLASLLLLGLLGVAQRDWELPALLPGVPESGRGPPSGVGGAKGMGVGHPLVAILQVVLVVAQRRHLLPRDLEGEVGVVRGNAEDLARHGRGLGSRGGEGPLDRGWGGGAGDGGGLAAGDGAGGGFGFLLVGVAGGVDAACGPTAVLLLDDVGELVGEQALAGGRAGVVLAAGEEDVAAHGEGAGAEALGGLGGPLIGMEPHGREVGAEPGAHQGLAVGGEGAADVLALRDLGDGVAGMPARCAPGRRAAVPLHGHPRGSGGVLRQAPGGRGRRAGRPVEAGVPGRLLHGRHELGPGRGTVVAGGPLGGGRLVLPGRGRRRTLRRVRRRPGLEHPALPSHPCHRTSVSSQA